MTRNDDPSQLNLVLAETLVPAAIATKEVKTKAFWAIIMDYMTKWKTPYLYHWIDT